jgi:predicted acyltransferase
MQGLTAATGSTMTDVAASSTTGRLASLDALRGFDMFWIIGGRELVLAFTAAVVSPTPVWLDAQLKHIAWGGFTFWDLIMPLFLFLVGTSMAFSFARRMQQAGRWPIYRKMLLRAAILWVLGMIAQGHLLDFDYKKLSVLSNTLQAIALGYLVAGVALLHLSRRGQVLLTAVLLVGYWLLMVCIPFDGHSAGTYEQKANLAAYFATIVSHYLPKGGYAWLPSTLTFGANVLLGVLAGHVLRATGSGWKKVCWLSLLGIGCLALGWIWSYWFPIVKWLFSSPFVLWACGWSYLLLALFYAVIDVMGFRRWAFPLVVIGSNAIVAYCFHFPDPTVQIQWRGISDPLLTGLARHLGRFGEPLLMLAGFAVMWSVLYVLYRNKKFLRV